MRLSDQQIRNVARILANGGKVGFPYRLNSEDVAAIESETRKLLARAGIHFPGDGVPIRARG